MIARTIPFAMALASLVAVPFAAAQDQQQRTGVLATIPLATDAVPAQVVGDSTLKDFSGKARVTLSLVQASREICYDVVLTDVPNVAEAGIRKAPRGQNGPSVLMFTLRTDTSATKACAKATDEVFADISANPTNFYVQVSTVDHPMGAIRGQLAKPPE